MKLYATVEAVLKNEPNFVTDDGDLKKWVIISKAQNCDTELISLLLENPEIKTHFFIPIKDVLVFNQALFIEFMEQKNYLNDSFTTYKNKIGLTINGKFLNQRNEVALVWPYKDCILEGGQSREEDKREEIFFNEVLAQDEINQLLDPKVLTNVKTYTAEGEKLFEGFTRNEQGTITDNLVIKGNNLLALHSLKEEFAGKVKLIYIDPPYNTGSDSFGYNDNFNHSTWLTFMRNRLQVAKELLREDGLIFIQCDDNQQAYLKVLCDETFESINFINTIIPEMSNMSGPKIEHAIKGRRFPKIKEYIHLYSKNKSNYKLLIPKTTKEKWDKEYNLIIPNFQFSEYEKLNLAIENSQILQVENILKSKKLISIKEYCSQNNIDLSEEWLMQNSFRILASKPNDALRKIADNLIFENSIGVLNNKSGGIKLIKTDYNRNSETARIELGFAENYSKTFIGDIWFKIVTTGGVAQEGGVVLKNGKKPEQLLKIIIESTTNPNDIVLDYHLGSGTTAAVAHKMNRQFIGIEQLDYGENDSVIRLKNVINGDQTGISKSANWQGGGSFTYLELKKYNQTFVDKILEAKDSETLFGIWEEMKNKSFLNYNIAIQKQSAHIEEFKKLEFSAQQELLIALLDKNQLYVNLSSLEDTDFGCTAEELKVTQDFYQLNKKPQTCPFDEGEIT